ncbi:NADP-dependent D-sorbitol-6-phosphate dehydrogenase [Nymphaea thermarum]|nr:NADP-dependent D-sorbitol-6-phosphate dehydrogenase [Nymphaea thermarum]
MFPPREVDNALDANGVLEIDTTISLETTWHAMEELVSMGLVRSIGIRKNSNFWGSNLETHPYLQREDLVKFCQRHGICVTAHTPLRGAAANTEWFGSVSCLEDPVLVISFVSSSIKKKRKTAVIPKTSKFERLKENIEVFDFETSAEDMDTIKRMDRKASHQSTGCILGTEPCALLV